MFNSTINNQVTRDVTEIVAVFMDELITMCVEQDNTAGSHNVKPFTTPINQPLVINFQTRASFVQSHAMSSCSHSAASHRDITNDQIDTTDTMILEEVKAKYTNILNNDPSIVSIQIIDDNSPRFQSIDDDRVSTVPVVTLNSAGVVITREMCRLYDPLITMRIKHQSTTEQIGFELESMLMGLRANTCQPTLLSTLVMAGLSNAPLDQNKIQVTVNNIEAVSYDDVNIAGNVIMANVLDKLTELGTESYSKITKVETPPMAHVFPPYGSNTPMPPVEFTLMFYVEDEPVEMYPMKIERYARVN